jgi:hypothetical protein
MFLYNEDFYFVGQLHNSVLQSDRCIAGCEAHMNFADDSVCLTADMCQNEVVTIHRSQEVLKILSLYMYISFAINCFVKKHRYSNPSCTYSTPNNHLSWDVAELYGLDVDSVNSGSEYFAY